MAQLGGVLLYARRFSGFERCSNASGSCLASGIGAIHMNAASSERILFRLQPLVSLLLLLLRTTKA